jgi:orotidine-5'-phosphate decarboxylase
LNYAQHSTELIIALDFARPEKAFEFVEQVHDFPVIFKVGLELFMCGGADLVRELVHRKYRVFLDLKFCDIPNTVARAAKQAALLHVEMITVHLMGGSAMVRATLDELSDIPLLRPKLLGVSVLTSFDDVRWAEVTRALTGHAMNAEDSVLGLVAQSSLWGMDGVVCSAAELSLVRSRFPGLYTVVPGIRPDGAQSQDQSRVTTPARARKLGAHAIVIGRPVIESNEPRSVVESILKDLSPSLVST